MTTPKVITKVVMVNGATRRAFVLVEGSTNECAVKYGDFPPKVGDQILDGIIL